MRDALATWHIGKVIRAYRHHPHHGRRPLSQEVVGGWLDLSQAQLSRLENGPTLKDLGRLAHYARTIGIPAALLWFKLADAAEEDAATPAQPGTDEAKPGQSPNSVLLPVLVGGRPVLLPLDADRLKVTNLAAHVAGLTVTGGDDPPVVGVGGPLSRWLLAQSISTMALPTLDLDEMQHVAAALTDARRYFDGPVIEYFRRQLDGCKAEDGTRGPHKTLPMVLGVLAAIEEHGREVRPDIRRDLLSVGASGAEFAGWLYRDLQQPAAATYWHDRATEWAQEAGNLPMQGYVLLKKSQMAYDKRDAMRVLTLAQAAQYGPWQLPPKVRAEVTQQEARGLAMVGEPIDLIERRIDEARTLLDQADTGHDAPDEIGAYYDEHVLMLRTASCYVEAGQPQRAAALFGDVLATDTLSRRDRGYFLARQATSLALCGEPGEAAAAGLEAAKIMAVMGSSRTRQELNRTVITLQPWRNRPGPQELREALQT